MAGKRFSGQVAWITGGGSGIGRALALAFAREGAAVAVSGRRADRLEEVAEEIRAEGASGIGVACDVADEASVKEAADAVVARLGKLDVAVANAGYSVAGRLESLTAADLSRQLAVNVVGLHSTVRFSLPHLYESRGRIGLVGSVASFIPTPNVGAYAASKAAVRMYGQTLSIELFGSGVTCTTIHPGFVESEIAQVDNQGRFHAERADKRPKQLMWPADKAAGVMVDALWSRRREYVFTAHGKVGAALGQHAPGFVHLVQTRFGNPKDVFRSKKKR